MWHVIWRITIDAVAIVVCWELLGFVIDLLLRPYTRDKH